jgi:hypothetical protein
MNDPDSFLRSLFRLPGQARTGASVHLTIPTICNPETRVDETISNCPQGLLDRCQAPYHWQSKYQLTIDKANCKITVTMKLKVTGAVTQAQQDAWKSAIETKWNNKAVFSCTGCNCTMGLTVAISVQFVTSGEHYLITAQPAGTTIGGVTGLGGTTSMQGWGVNDTIDVTHEFGHMLGNVEEYFTTNGVDYTYGGTKRGYRDPDGGIMNNSANDPRPANYDSIRAQVEKCLGGATCTFGPPQVGVFPENPTPDTANA